MLLKPKSTVKNNRALVYRRFTNLERSLQVQTVYKTQGGTINEKIWVFNAETSGFVRISASEATPQQVVDIETGVTILTYKDKFFIYKSVNGLPPAWHMLDELPETYEALSAKFGNVAKYQVNRYYYVGSFDFMIKGSMSETTTQYLKGNVIPLTVLNIKHFNDDVHLSVDDLVVVNGHLYSVENPETTLKMLPKPFAVHYATLNSIL